MGYQFILPKLLAQGSAPPPEAQLPFDVLVLCAREYQPPASYFPGVEVLHVPLDDSGPPPTTDEVRLAVLAGKRVCHLLRKGKRVLVTCAMGRNRSGLVSGLALINCGASSSRAIDAIKQARANALSNAYFREILHAHSRNQGRDSTAAFA